MEAYAKILNFAIPFFLVLIAIEHGASLVMKIKTNRIFDVISSLSSGITNVVKDVLGLSIVIISYSWLVQHFAISHIDSTWLVYVLAFIGIDFSGYWVHRWSHEFNLFWNRHIIHHSSEEYNLACALRQSVSEIFALFTFTYIPMAILGIPANVIAVVAPIQLFSQFWYHTRLISKMGWLEYIIVTPSHHRVHHSINPIYMDKNYSQIFIVWDKIFGTFQVELKDETPVYGVTRAVHTWNPWIINYQHLWLLCKDAWHTKSWKNKAVIWFKPTGWRPEDVIQNHPVEYTQNIYDRPKYNTEAGLGFQIWSAFQLVLTLGFMMYLFNNLSQVTTLDSILYGLFLFITIFSYTSLMDGSSLSIWAELLKIFLAVYLILSHSFSWFGIEDVLPFGTMIVIGYLGISLLFTLYFYFIDKPKVVYLQGV